MADPDIVAARLDYANWRESAAATAQLRADLYLQEAQSHRQWVSDLRAEVGHCHHCGKPDEADGDHSCPCPYSNEKCAEHPAPRTTEIPSDD